jgi:hypothetical protein
MYCSGVCTVPGNLLICEVLEGIHLILLTPIPTLSCQYQLSANQRLCSALPTGSATSETPETSPCDRNCALTCDASRHYCNGSN